MDPNQHIEDYLEYYLTSPDPLPFAVMLKGPWGVGKTHFIKRVRKNFQEKTGTCLYISLYGLKSLDEVDDALVRALNPFFAKNLESAGRLGSLLKTKLGVDFLPKPEDILKRSNVSAFIFDDLERSDIPTNSILGYINEFVEHEKRKVIIVANEAEIKSEEYTRIREKLIGKTFELQSSIDRVLNEFIDSVRDEAVRELYRAAANNIREIYDQSELNNMRILEQTMREFERLHASLDSRHKEHNEAMKELLGVVFAISFELRSGRLQSEDLRDRYLKLITSHSRSRQGEESLDSVSAVQARYPGVDIATRMLSDEVLVSFFGKGLINATQLHAELDAVTNPDSEPEWRTVWHAFSRTEAQFNAALAKMEKKFLSREYTASGEILHVISLQLWLARIGVVSFSAEEVRARCKTYIDQLRAERRIKSIRTRNRVSQLDFESYDGLGFHEKDNQYFKELSEYLIDQQLAADADLYPAHAESLSELIEADRDEFRRKISLHRDGGGDFYNIPVLKFANIDKFLSRVLSLDPSARHEVLRALKARYDNNALENDLGDEREWLQIFRSKLAEAAEGMSKISRYVLLRQIEHTLDEVLSTK